MVNPPGTPPDSRSGDSREPALRLVLEIRRGRTGFPTRPVDRDRFLIGGGASCDLRLGGDGMPVLHSIIVADAPAVRIEAIAESPPLRVNGQTVRESRLGEADVVEIGPFEFIVRRPASAGETDRAQADARPQHVPELTGDSLADGQKLDQLSAEELVDLIEQEQQQVERFDEGRSTGAQALLQTARTRSASDASNGRTAAGAEAPTANSDWARPSRIGRDPHAVVPEEADQPPQTAPIPADSTATVVHRLDQGVARLQALAGELEERAQKVARREIDPTKATAELLDLQQKLAEQLEALLQHIESLQGDRSRSLRSAA